MIRQAILVDLSAVRQQRLHLSGRRCHRGLYSSTLDDWAEDLAHNLWEASLIASIEQTLRWLKTAARRAAEQGAHQAAAKYLSWDLQVLSSMPQSSERTRQELRLNVRLIAPLSTAKCYTRLK